MILNERGYYDKHAIPASLTTDSELQSEIVCFIIFDIVIMFLRDCMLFTIHKYTLFMLVTSRAVGIGRIFILISILIILFIIIHNIIIFMITIRLTQSQIQTLRVQTFKF